MNFKTIAAALIATTALAFAVVTSSSVNAQTVQTTTSVETVLDFAALQTVNAPTQGTVALVRKTDGKTVLRLQNLKTEAGPDLHVYLYAAAVPAKSADAKTVKSVKYVDLGKLPAPFSGFYEYAIPANTDLTQFKSLIIWCDVAGVTFAGANL
jgi:Cu/Zn superoxide dismutase